MVLETCGSSRSTRAHRPAVAADAVLALLGERLELGREQERSLWLHRAVLDRLAIDPEGTLRVAMENVRRWRRGARPGGMTQHWLNQWELLLGRGPDAVAEVLTSRTPEAIELRQNPPFAGVHAKTTRARVLAAFNQH